MKINKQAYETLILFWGDYITWSESVYKIAYPILNTLLSEYESELI